MLTLSAKLKTASIVAIAVASLSATPVLAEDITLWTLNFDNNAANTALKKVATDFEAANPGTHGLHREPIDGLIRPDQEDRRLGKQFGLFDAD